MPTQRVVEDVICKEEVRMSERDNELLYLKELVKINKIKQKQYQIEKGCGDEVGFFTKEIMLLASHLPQMRRLGITIDDIES